MSVLILRDATLRGINAGCRENCRWRVVKDKVESET